MRSFSFCTFSYNAHFHFTPSPITPIFIPRLLLRRQFSFPALSYCAYFYLFYLFIKDMRGERTSPPPTLFGINPPPTPYATPLSCQDSEVTTGGASNPFHSKHQFHAGPQRRRNLFSFRVFSYNAYFYLPSSSTTHIFIPRILL
jgi:hypothetical protein